MSLAVGPDDARRSRLVAGSAVARLDSKTKAASGFGHGAKRFERQLTEAQGRSLPCRPRCQRRSGLPGPKRNQHGDAPRPRLCRRYDRVGAGQGLARRQGLARTTRHTGGPASRSTAASATTAGHRSGSAGWRRRIRCSAAGSVRFTDRGGSSSLFLDVEARRNLGSGWSATIMGRRGWTEFASGKFTTAAYSFDLAKYGLLRSADRFGLRIAQPLRVESGGMSMLLPTGYDYAIGNGDQQHPAAWLHAVGSGNRRGAQLFDRSGQGLARREHIRPAPTRPRRFRRTRHGRRDPIQPRLLIRAD